MRIARVFPTKTKASPTDDLAFFGPPGLFPPEVDEVHISVTFTWDLARAGRLAEQWQKVAPVKIGGPATGMRSEEFKPGMYLKPGYLITSRGCPNKCWFCSVPQREGAIRELSVIQSGWNVLDDNLLACSQGHIETVFLSLRVHKAQGKQIEFTGGLEAARLTDFYVHLLAQLKPKQMFFAYDTPYDLEPLMEAGRKLFEAGFTAASHALRCYVLIGYPTDNFEFAETRLQRSMECGFTPMAMLWRDESGKVDAKWRRFQRAWARPASIHATHRMRAC
jgi:hypothetical protein